MCNSIHQQCLVIMCIPQSIFGQFGSMPKVEIYTRGNHWNFICYPNRLHPSEVSFIVSRKKKLTEDYRLVHCYTNMGDRSGIFVSGLANKELTGFWSLYV
jgi:hypothetical protein